MRDSPLVTLAAVVFMLAVGFGLILEWALSR